jgi:hypothetical protein
MKEPLFKAGSAMPTAGLNVFAGWIGIFLGVLAGSFLGLFYYKDDWAGGYSSFRRRMLRLGHIALFGLGIINVLYGLTVESTDLVVPFSVIASVLLVVGAAMMPTCCYLTAWRKPFRHLFPIPVVCVAVGVVLLLIGWVSR